MFKPINPAYSLISEIRETTELKTVAELLNSGDWIAITAAASKDGQYLFVLGRVR